MIKLRCTARDLRIALSEFPDSARVFVMAEALHDFVDNVDISVAEDGEVLICGLSLEECENCEGTGHYDGVQCLFCDGYGLIANETSS